eukprot:7797702-Karenia_brevis.AAC.1
MPVQEGQSAWVDTPGGDMPANMDSQTGDAGRVDIPAPGMDTMDTAGGSGGSSSSGGAAGSSGGEVAVGRGAVA